MNKLQALMETYLKDPTEQNKEQVIIEGSKIVKIIAKKICSTLNQDSVLQLEDYESFGIFGLLDAINKYDLSQNVQFDTYASLRIRGSIYDEIRKFSYIKRPGLEAQKQYKQLQQDAIQHYGRNCTLEELAEYAQQPIEKIKELQSKAHHFRDPTSLDALLLSNIDSYSDGISFDITDPNIILSEQEVLRNELSEVLKQALNVLTPKQRQVIEMYYYEDLSLAEIAKILDVTQSRVSQMHTRSLQKIKPVIAQYLDIPIEEEEKGKDNEKEKS